MRLFENTAQRSNRNLGLLRYDGRVPDVVHSADELDVTALLADLYEARRFETALTSRKSWGLSLA